MARFSSLKGNFNTLYAAASLAAAVAETIIRDRFEGVTVRRLFTSELAGSCVAPLTATALLDLVDLRTDGCFQLGVSTDIASARGEDDGWAASRELAQYIHDHTALDGFLYRSRLTGANCVAVFDRAVASKMTAGTARALPAARRLADALAALSVEVIL
ncbi:RES family NAD+ phosphorylase [Sphingomonas sp. So64.6b]|uniref:RES family NAD+ phosphorylase n=1 Tax=Sphingomonas sp. So64.6b TaxID=2997354 RepID=UPI001FCF09DE|nr:RES family NAD+ phosphorylase [Sphingomonas sp. So64.6b]